MRQIHAAFIEGKFCSPTEFWRLRPGEVLMIIKAHTREARARLSTRSRLRQLFEEAKQRG